MLIFTDLSSKDIMLVFPQPRLFVSKLTWNILYVRSHYQMGPQWPQIDLSQSTLCQHVYETLDINSYCHV